MGVILPGVERDVIFPHFFRGIGTGRDKFLWEWDGRGLSIHSRVTLYYIRVALVVISASAINEDINT